MPISQLGQAAILGIGETTKGLVLSPGSEMPRKALGRTRRNPSLHLPPLPPRIYRKNGTSLNEMELDLQIAYTQTCASDRLPSASHRNKHVQEKTSQDPRNNMDVMMSTIYIYTHMYTDLSISVRNVVIKVLIILLLFLVTPHKPVVHSKICSEFFTFRALAFAPLGLEELRLDQSGHQKDLQPALQWNLPRLREKNGAGSWRAVG